MQRLPPGQSRGLLQILVFCILSISGILTVSVRLATLLHRFDHRHLARWRFDHGLRSLRRAASASAPILLAKAADRHIPMQAPYAMVSRRTELRCG
jgi:hypothetical protein